VVLQSVAHAARYKQIRVCFSNNYIYNFFLLGGGSNDRPCKRPSQRLLKAVLRSVALTTRARPRVIILKSPCATRLTIYNDSKLTFEKFHESILAYSANRIAEERFVAFVMAGKIILND